MTLQTVRIQYHKVIKGQATKAPSKTQRGGIALLALMDMFPNETAATR